MTSRLEYWSTGVPEDDLEADPDIFQVHVEVPRPSGRDEGEQVGILSKKNKQMPLFSIATVNMASFALHRIEARDPCNG